MSNEKNNEFENLSKEELVAKMQEMQKELELKDQQLKTEIEVRNWAVEGAQEFQKDAELNAMLYEDAVESIEAVRPQIVENEKKAKAFDSAVENPIKFAFQQLAENAKGKVVNAIPERTKEQKISKFKAFVMKKELQLKKEGLSFDRTESLVKRAMNIASFQVSRSITKTHLKVDEVSEKVDRKVTFGAAVAGKTISNVAKGTWNLTGGKVVKAGKSVAEGFNGMVQKAKKAIDLSLLKQEAIAVRYDGYKSLETDSVIARAAHLGTAKVIKGIIDKYGEVKKGLEDLHKGVSAVFKKVARNITEGALEAGNNAVAKKYDHGHGL